MYDGTGVNKIQQWTENGEQEWVEWDADSGALTVFYGHLKWDAECVTTLTVFNGHIYSCGGGIKIQKWTENGELVQEYKHTDDDRNVFTLTFFNGHLYSVVENSVVDFRIQKWKKKDMYLFFQIFYKGTVYKYNLEAGILEKIASYIPMFYI
jgi:hypothetical protein